LIFPYQLVYEDYEYIEEEDLSSIDDTGLVFIKRSRDDDSDDEYGESSKRQKPEDSKNKDEENQEAENSNSNNQEAQVSNSQNQESNDPQNQETNKSESNRSSPVFDSDSDMESYEGVDTNHGYSKKDVLTDDLEMVREAKEGDEESARIIQNEYPAFFDSSSLNNEAEGYQDLERYLINELEVAEAEAEREAEAEAATAREAEEQEAIVSNENNDESNNNNGSDENGGSSNNGESNNNDESNDNNGSNNSGPDANSGNDNGGEAGDGGNGESNNSNDNSPGNDNSAYSKEEILENVGVVDEEEIISDEDLSKDNYLDSKPFTTWLILTLGWLGSILDSILDKFI
jgi:hypothetical protein